MNFKNLVLASIFTVGLTSATQAQDNIQDTLAYHQNIPEFKEGKDVILPSGETAYVFAKYTKDGAKKAFVATSEANLDNITGTEYIFYNNGNIKSVSEVRNGSAHGVTETFYKTGELKKNGRFVNGLIDGDITTYYKSGQEKEIIQHENGIPVKTTSFDKNGNITLVEGSGPLHDLKP